MANTSVIFLVKTLLKMLMAIPTIAIPHIKVQDLGNGIYFGTMPLTTFIK